MVAASTRGGRRRDLALHDRALGRARPLPLRGPAAPARGRLRRPAGVRRARASFAEGLSPELERALGELSAAEREVIALRVVLDFDPDEAARLLGISKTACTTRLSRALAKLQEKVATMSLPDLDPRFDDLVRELRAQPPQPPRRARRSASRASPRAPAAPRREPRWRRPLLVLAPVATLVLAGVGASLLLGRDSGRDDRRRAGTGTSKAAVSGRGRVRRSQADELRARLPQGHGARPTDRERPTLAPAPFRATEEHASFTLQVEDQRRPRAPRRSARCGSSAPSAATSSPRRRASRATGKGDSTLTVKVPIGHVQQAIARLSALGHILSQEHPARRTSRRRSTGSATARRAHGRDPLARARARDRRPSPPRRARASRRSSPSTAPSSPQPAARRGARKRGRLATIDLSFTTRHNVSPCRRSIRARRGAR